MKRERAAQAVASAITDDGLSMKAAKRIVAKALGLTRVHSSRLAPVLELGEKLRLFLVRDDQVEKFTFECPEIPSFDMLSDKAREYYLRNIQLSATPFAKGIYKSQAEAYLEYCNTCKSEGRRAVHPKLWMSGYNDLSEVPIDELIPEPSRAILDMPLPEVYED